MKTESNEISIILCPATDQHPRRDCASLIPFDDGRIFLAYTHFYDGIEGDEGPSDLRGMWSQDDGDSWSEPILIQKNIGRVSVIEPSLLRLPSGRVLMSFMRQDRHFLEPGGNALVQMVCYSDDECRTWSRPVGWNEANGEEVCNDRFVRLGTGRILLPGSRVWFSDDEGTTWRHSKTGGGCETSVAELADGSLLMFSRSGSSSREFRLTPTRSYDGGETWVTDKCDWGPNSSNSPCIVRRVPNSDDLLLIWNNNLERTDLSSALSHDGGRTWVNIRHLEPSEGWPVLRGHAYPSLMFSRGNAHLTYRESHKTSNALAAVLGNERGEPHRVMWYTHLVYRRLPIDWFYAPPVAHAQTPRRAPLYDLHKIVNDYFFPAESDKPADRKNSFTG